MPGTTCATTQARHSAESRPAARIAASCASFLSVIAPLRCVWSIDAGRLPSLSGGMRMSAEKPQVVYRRDYRPPDYRIDAVDLDFDLREDETLVRARLAIHRDPAVKGDLPPLVLAGQGLETLSVAIDGRPLGAREYGDR